MRRVQSCVPEHMGALYDICCALYDMIAKEQQRATRNPKKKRVQDPAERKIPGMSAAEAAEAREELAWSSYTALSALAFVSHEDLVRELVVIAGHTVSGTSGDADAPIVSESMVNEFLQLQGAGIPEDFDQFVELHNRLIDWAIASSGSTGGASLRLSPGGRRSNSSPLGRSVSRAASHRAMEGSPQSFRARPPADLVLINPTEDAPGLISPVASRHAAPLPRPSHGCRR